MDDELTKEQQAELARALTAMRTELEVGLRDATDGARPVALDQPIGRLSRVDALQQQAMAQATRRGMELRLQLVQQALTAIERGEYGYCRMCDEPIAYKRLLSKPETPFCVRCQRGREH